MSVTSTTELVDLLRRFRLLDAAQLEQLTREWPGGSAEFRSLADDLLLRGWLTSYQIDKIACGDVAGLLLGSYVLLERLGQGGMGTVFKARNWKLGRVVALKLIRKERLDNPEILRRFRREIRAAAQLDHPNIVRALDADEVNGTHLLVMEYVQGVDLAKVIKSEGPLPVVLACEYARQAALGLQHAHERGLVHRDIKPHNLLVTSDLVVKILDMGLARLGPRLEEGESSASVTGEGVVVGTADYIAPEQAWESHDVDIRADLYSLGCTLYQLLTGRPPFPGAKFLEKLHKHKYEEPTPVETLRPGVPPAAAAVVRRLMAKQPEDRYQTPAEAALALEVALSRASDSPPSTVAEAAAPAENAWSRLLDDADSGASSTPRSGKFLPP